MISEIRRRDCAADGIKTIKVLHPDALMMVVQSWRTNLGFRYLPDATKILIDGVEYTPEELSYVSGYSSSLTHESFASGEHTIYIYPKNYLELAWAGINNGGSTLLVARSGRMYPKIGGYLTRKIQHFLDLKYVTINTSYEKNVLLEVFVPVGKYLEFLENSSLSGVTNIANKIIEVNFEIIED